MPIMRRLVILILAILFAQTALAWNATGHEAVAAIAWDNMTPVARTKAIALLKQAPQNACLLDLLPNDTRPEPVRNREFFIRVATWPDVIRPAIGTDKDHPDPRPCVKLFAQPTWHFFDRFWQGTSGATGTAAPKDRTDIALATTNAVERLQAFRPLVECKKTPCGASPADRAMDLAWIVHLVGDIHQPLHTSGHVTTEPDELAGDQGGNKFKLKKDDHPPVLHSFWDDIIDESIPRKPAEFHNDIAYVDRVIGTIETDHPKASVVGHLKPGDFDAWSLEGLATAKRIGYPASLHRGERPSEAYRKTVFAAADEAIATAGYRLADLLNGILK
jgi:hypothetical protein